MRQEAARWEARVLWRKFISCQLVVKYYIIKLALLGLVETVEYC